MKKLSFGLMRLPLKSSDHSDIDHEKLCEMVDHFMAKGFTHFDTAYVYHGGKSEVAFRECVVKRYPRESFLLADKMPVGMLVMKGDTSRIFRHQLKRCGV